MLLSCESCYAVVFLFGLSVRLSFRYFLKAATTVTVVTAIKQAKMIGPGRTRLIMLPMLAPTMAIGNIRVRTL